MELKMICTTALAFTVFGSAPIKARDGGDVDGFESY
jgi:hypothetical protein